MIVAIWPVWVTVLVVLIGIALFFRLSRVLGLLMVAIAVFNGVASTNWPFGRIETGFWFVLLVLVGLALALLSALQDLPRFVQHIGRIAASAALILALLNSFWALPGAIQSAINDPMRVYVNAQVDQTNKRVDNLVAAQTDKDKEQDARISSLEKRVTDVEERVTKVENRITKTETALNGVVSVKLAGDTNQQALVERLSADLKGAGWKAGDFTVGTVDWNGHVPDRGDASFTKYTLTTQESVRQFINGSSPNQAAARDYLLSRVPASERDRLLSGVGFIPVQFNKEICLNGNTYFDGKHAVTMKDKRCHPAGYVVWIYTGADGKVYWDAAIASDCGNPGMTSVVRPKDKPEQPASKLCTEGDYKGHTPVNGSCFKPKPVATATKTVPGPTTTATATTTVTKMTPGPTATATTTVTTPGPTATVTTTVPAPIPSKTSVAPPPQRPTSISSPTPGDTSTYQPTPPPPKSDPLQPNG